MRYKIMVKGAAYKAARTAKLYTAFRCNSFEKYVGVTPGETYTIYGRNVAAGATIEWSDEINTHAVDVTI